MNRTEGIVSLVRKWIENGALAPGAKAPSVRQMSRITGYSMSTVHNAYGALESAGIFIARPRSGFYVDKVPALAGDIADAAPEAAPAISIDALTHRLFASWNNNELQQFGAIYPCAELFPVNEIHKQFRRALRTMPSKEWETHSMSAQGDRGMREALARRYVEHGAAVWPDDVVLTGGGMHGLNLCLSVLTKPGDTVLVESPSMFPIFTALAHRGLRPVEITYSQKHGLDPEEFKYLADLHNVRACVLMPAHHFPTGVSTPADAVEEIVRFGRERNLPIIENGGYMDLHYGPHAPTTLKKFDEDGQVLQIGSFSNTLAPGYGIGWLLPGRYREGIIQMKFASNLISGAFLQRAFAGYMRSGGFDRHLRTLRSKLQNRMAHGLRLIEETFPQECRREMPSGGFMCWVEGPPNFDSVAASREAMSLGIGLPPGPAFSACGSFRNYIGLNFSFPWNDYSESRLKSIGDLIRKHSQSRPRETEDRMQAPRRLA
jgi:DNA-binding transcriptional MocR family regulator